LAVKSFLVLEQLKYFKFNNLKRKNESARQNKETDVCNLAVHLLAQYLFTFPEITDRVDYLLNFKC